jgi:hypothetical protein
MRAAMIASGVASGSTSDRALLRRVVAWRNGDACIGRYDRSSLALQVTRVIEGTPLPMRESPGTQSLEVVVLDDAAARAESSDLMQTPPGRWSLTRMPDGTPVVSALADTAWGKPAPDTTNVRNEVEAVRAGLHASDPQQRFDALRRFERMRCFSLGGDVLAFADSEERVVDPEGGRE